MTRHAVIDDVDDLQPTRMPLARLAVVLLARVKLFPLSLPRETYTILFGVR